MDRRPEPADSLGRRWMQRLLPRRRASASVGRPEAKVLAVASGKGGTGKSFLATNLAVALSQAGRRVCVVDCDFGLGNAHLLLGVNPRRSLQHVLSGSVRAVEAVEATPHGPGLLAGGSGISSLAEFGSEQFALLAQGIGELAQDHDVLVLDCAAGISTQSILTMLGADHVLLVTNPDIAALTDAYALVKCLARHERCPEVHVVVNRVAEAGQGRPTFDRLAEVSRRFVGRSLHYLGEVAENSSVSHRRLGQPPLLISCPECAEAKAIHSILCGLELAAGPLQSSLQAPAGSVERRMLRQRLMR